MNRLKELRKRFKLNQETAGKIAGVKQSTYSGWETGHFQIDDASKIKLAKFYGVSIDYLLGFSTSENDDSIQRSEELISTYLHGIDVWSQNKFLSESEKAAVKEHFSDLLLRYKQLINDAVNSLMTLSFSENDLENLENKQINIKTIKELYLKQELDKDIADIQNWISQLPRLLSK